MLLNANEALSGAKENIRIGKGRRKREKKRPKSS
jgi:hypothetical protein